MSTKRTAEIEVEVGDELATLTVEYTISGEYRRAQTSGPIERCYPAEWPQVDVIRIADSDGVEIDRALVWRTDAHYLDWQRAMIELEADIAADDYSAAMERKAEERLDR
jgi:hypothetical protein